VGTSSNHASPRTPSWAIARSLLGLEAGLPESQSRELWRAAMGDVEASPARLLAVDCVAKAYELAGSSRSAPEAFDQYDDYLISNRAGGLVADLARRALGRAVAQGEGKRTFAAEIFAETVSYYAARDLPSVIGGPGRVPIVSDSISLKESFRSIARQAALSRWESSLELAQWPGFVTSVCNALVSRE